jgi:hypothetical protein
MASMVPDLIESIGLSANDSHFINGAIRKLMAGHGNSVSALHIYIGANVLSLRKSARRPRAYKGL